LVQQELARKVSVVAKKFCIRVRNILTNLSPNPARLTTLAHVTCHDQGSGADPGVAIAPPKTFESNFIYHNSVQFEKQHSRYKATLSSIAFSQGCCKILHLSYSSEAVMRPDCQIILKSPTLTSVAGSAPTRCRY